jgi:hypothetical protein
MYRLLIGSYLQDKCLLKRNCAIYIQLEDTDVSTSRSSDDGSSWLQDDIKIISASSSLEEGGETWLSYSKAEILFESKPSS